MIAACLLLILIAVHTVVATAPMPHPLFIVHHHHHRPSPKSRLKSQTTNHHSMGQRMPMIDSIIAIDNQLPPSHIQYAGMNTIRSYLPPVQWFAMMHDRTRWWMLRTCRSHTGDGWTTLKCCSSQWSWYFWNPFIIHVKFLLTANTSIDEYHYYNQSSVNLLSGLTSIMFRII